MQSRVAELGFTHSCSLRFEICNFNAASLYDKLFRSRHAGSLSRKRTGSEPLMPNMIRKCPEAMPEMLYVNHV